MLSNGGALAAGAFHVALRRFPRVANACLLSISVRRSGDFVARSCLLSRNVFENKMTSFQ